MAEGEKRKFIRLNSAIENGLKKDATPQEMAETIAELRRQLKHCRARWTEGMAYLAPGVEEKPSGFCSQPDGHEGDHIFPNNNRQPQRDKQP